jgi:hypothetical protein
MAAPELEFTSVCVEVGIYIQTNVVVYMAGCFDVYETKNYHHGIATGVFTVRRSTENYLSKFQFTLNKKYVSYFRSDGK